MIQYYNVHSHRVATAKNCTSILNLSEDFFSITDKQFYSIGVHPWELSHHTKRMDEVRRLCNLPNILAIGETGIDKMYPATLSLQKEVFREHIAIANQCNKPLLIHCVRAFSEVIEILDDCENKMPVIFHGYNKNKDLANTVMEHGYYLSFGKAILNNTGAIESLKNCRTKQLFLETDDAEIEIQDVYKTCSEILQKDIQDLCNLVETNFKTIFNIK